MKAIAAEQYFKNNPGILMTNRDKDDIFVSINKTGYDNNIIY